MIRATWLILALPLWALVFGVAPARAQVALDQLTSELDLAPDVEVLEDGALDFADARRATFTRNTAREVSFGFSSAPVWLRFQTENTRALRWTLELGEPSLDQVQLYIVHRDGSLEVHEGGDALPFARRELPYARTAFELESAARDRATYYLHVQTEDVLRIPLHAYTPRAFAAHQQRIDGLIWAAYGVLLMFAGYNFAVYWLVKRSHYLSYVFMCLAFVLVLMTLNGHVAQLLLPTKPQLVARMMPCSLALACVCVVAFMTIIAMRIPELWSSVSFVRLTYAAIGLLAFCTVAPVAIGTRLLAAILFCVTCAGPVILARLAELPYPELYLFRLSWYTLVVAIPVAILRYANVLPAWSPILDWALPIGFVGHGLVMSLALPAWVSGMEGRVAAVNEQLTQNVNELQQALTRAEEANEQARRATKAKDEFVATMSHELRTPLNAIINIPQGLIGEFAVMRSAKCGQCNASYLLDAADVISAITPCEGCHQQGTLSEGKKVKFRGDDARALRFLEKIERSGQHLLQMVNGVLDYSKLEAGRFELVMGPVELDPLLREVHDQMVDIAQRKNIQLELSCAQAGRPLTADALRLKQVLFNLVANAIKFSEPNTTVSMRWSTLPDGEQIEIEDRGIGIAAENHERVFTSFEQVHKGDTRKYGGTGLGLSISRSLVRMHGGELSVRSELGKGSVFVVRLPRMPMSAGSHQSGELRAAPDNDNLALGETPRAAQA